MDIEGLSMSMAQSQMVSSIGTQVLAMSIDKMETAGAGMIDMMNRSMMENSVNPNLGGNIDIMV